MSRRERRHLRSGWTPGRRVRLVVSAAAALEMLAACGTDTPDLLPIAAVLTHHTESGDLLVSAEPKEHRGPCGVTYKLRAKETANTITLQMTRVPPGPGLYGCFLNLPHAPLHDPIGTRKIIDASNGATVAPPFQDYPDS